MDLWNSGALGLAETHGMVTALRVADIAAKTSSVSIKGFEQVGGGLVTVSFTGDIESIRFAIDEIKQECQKLALPVVTAVIGRPAVPLNMVGSPIDPVPRRSAELPIVDAPAAEPMTTPPAVSPVLIEKPQPGPKIPPAPEAGN